MKAKLITSEIYTYIYTFLQQYDESYVQSSVVRLNHRVLGTIQNLWQDGAGANVDGALTFSTLLLLKF